MLVRTMPATAVRTQTISAFCFAIGILLAIGTHASADIGVAARQVPAAELVGKGRLTFFGFKVFDAELYAPRGLYRPSGPYALKLTYLRNFKSGDIVSRSAEEIRDQGGVSEQKLEGWTRQMQALFPDVKRGQSITGVHTASGTTEFYHGSRRLGVIRDPEFTKRFFAIWLGKRTSDPHLRARLTGSGS
ncbi:chalcone isomerase family protein [Roseibium sp.]|uniref:chalcone isomerase family protein n=1 Tax=Roseibium sp. TaxID=1936156 RepID=UPI003D0E2E57